VGRTGTFKTSPRRFLLGWYIRGGEKSFKKSGGGPQAKKKKQKVKGWGRKWGSWQRRGVPHPTSTTRWRRRLSAPHWAGRKKGGLKDLRALFLGGGVLVRPGEPNQQKRFLFYAREVSLCQGSLRGSRKDTRQSRGVWAKKPQTAKGSKRQGKKLQNVNIKETGQTTNPRKIK